jgi:hypothetical protein
VPDRADPVDLALVSRNGNGHPPWRSVDDTMPLHHVFKVAGRHETSLEELVRRLVTLGFAPPQLPPQQERDLLARLSAEPEARYGYEPGPGRMPSNAVVDIAWDYGLAEQDVAARLATLGYEVHDLDQHPRRPGSYTDLLLTSRDYNGTEPWLDVADQVPWHHVVRAAHVRRMQRDEAVATLLRYGYEVAPAPEPGNWSSGEDVAILRWTTGGLPTMWLPADSPVPLTHILHTAHRLTRTPHEVARRLQQFGHVLPDDVEFKERATR